MLNITKYYCGICNTKPDQISHHKSHLTTEKHKDKKELFLLKLKALTNDELIEKYNTIDINNIIDNIETIIVKNKNLNFPDEDLDDNNLIENETMVQKELIEKSESITGNKDALKDKIHEIHNYLRNNGAGYGMNALKVFNILYGLMRIEEANLLEKFNLNKNETTFSYLLELSNNNKNEQLCEIIYVKCLDYINDSELKKILFYEIPRNIKSNIFSHLIKEISSISNIEKTSNVLLSGKIYEYFIGRDESAISELGAYFTDRHIVDFIYSKADIQLNEDGTVPEMIDMFGGSGGFTTGYINYLNDNFNDINWATEVNKIFHYDMNEDVIKSAALEIFCLTGTLPDMDNNITYKNSFADNFNDKKFQYIITNPPYGGDKNKKKQADLKRDSIEEYIKSSLSSLSDEKDIIKRQNQLKDILKQNKTLKNNFEKQKVKINNCNYRFNKYAKKYNLNGNDKEACSLIQIMEMLEYNGTAIGVLKEGVFFNKTYKGLRKHLIEYFNVREVISIDPKQFENTATKTSIIIFDNTENKTENIKFSDLVIEKYTENKFEEILDKIYCTEFINDIKDVYDVLVSEANIDDIIKNNYSLNSKDYNKKTIIPGDDYKLVKLDDICQIKKGTRITKSNNISGDIPVYGGGDITFYTNKSNRDTNTLIISRYGMSENCSRIIQTKFYLNDSGLSILCKDKLLQNYINYLMISNLYKNIIYNNCTNGSCQKNINMNLFSNINIPIPKSDEKLQEWVDKISKPFNKKQKYETELKDLEKNIQDTIKNISENEECDKVKLGDIAEFKPKSKRNASYGKSVGKYNFYTSSDKIKKCDIADYNEELLIIGSGGVANIKFDKNFSCSADNFIISCINNYYIYCILKNNINLLSNGFNGSTLKHLSKDYLQQLSIPIPKDKQLIDGLEPSFSKIEKLQEKITKNDNLYKQYVKELSDEAIIGYE